MIIRQAAILVGGRGTRLGDLTADTPKPLLPIDGDTRFLDLLLRHVARHGFTDIVLLAGYHGDQVARLYDGRTIHHSRVRVVIEPEPLGTAGALTAARNILAPSFLLLNGDCLFDFNLRALASEAVRRGHRATLAARQVPDASRYGTVVVEGGAVTSFREKDGAARRPALINGGVYVLARDILDEIAALPASIERDIFPSLAERGELGGMAFDGYFLDIGLPETLEQGRRELMNLEHRPAAFLDRDGVLNHDSGYVHRPDQVVWIPGALDAVRRLNDLGYYVFVVTNQAGVAHGYYDEATMHALHRWMSDRFAEAGAFVDTFYHCPFHPSGKVPEFTRAHPDRKPGAGMLEKAFAEWPVVRSGSFLIGDRDTDMQAARAAGLPGFLFDGRDLSAQLSIALDAVPGAQFRMPTLSSAP